MKFFVTASFMFFLNTAVAKTCENAYVLSAQELVDNIDVDGYYRANLDHFVGNYCSCTDGTCYTNNDDHYNPCGPLGTKIPRTWFWSIGFAAGAS